MRSATWSPSAPGSLVDPLRAAPRYHVILHGLGRVAQQRDDYEAALEWYRKALAIEEALGNRVGMASSLSQIGVLLTETGKPHEGVAFNLQSLALRLSLKVSEVRTDLHWLGRQREALGRERFQTVLREHLSAEDADAVTGWLDDAGEDAE